MGIEIDILICGIREKKRIRIVAIVHTNRNNERR